MLCFQAGNKDDDCHAIIKERNFIKVVKENMKKDPEVAKYDVLTVISFDLMKTLPTPVISTGIAQVYMINLDFLFLNSQILYVSRCSSYV